DHFSLSRRTMPASTGYPWVAGAGGGSDSSPGRGTDPSAIWTSALPAAGVMGSEPWCVRQSRYGPRSDDAAYPWLLPSTNILYGRFRRAAWRSDGRFPWVLRVMAAE